MAPNQEDLLMQHGIRRILLPVPPIFAVIAFVILGMPMPSADSKSLSEDSRAQAQHLWEQAIGAKGGWEKLRRVTSMFIAIEIPGGDRDYDLYVFPRRYLNYSYGARREDTVITIFNGDLG